MSYNYDLEVMLEENKIKSGLKGLSTWFKEKMDSIKTKIGSLRKKEPELPPEKKSVFNRSLDLCKKILSECKKGLSACKSGVVDTAVKIKDIVMGLLEDLSDAVRSLASYQAGKHAGNKYNREMNKRARVNKNITGLDALGATAKAYHPDHWEKGSYNRGFEKKTDKTADKIYNKLQREALRKASRDSRKELIRQRKNLNW